MTVREFALARLSEEAILTQWAQAVTGEVAKGLGVLELRRLVVGWSDHPDYREEWRP